MEKSGLLFQNGYWSGRDAEEIGRNGKGMMKETLVSNISWDEIEDWMRLETKLINLVNNVPFLHM